MKKSIRMGRLAACLMGLGLAVFLFAGSALEVAAAPANPHPFEFNQGNGDFTLFFRGNEFFSWWEDDGGFVVALDEATNNWRYAQVVNGAIMPNGQLVCSFSAALVNAAPGTALGAGIPRIDRGAILPLIQNTWRFDQANPMLEFRNGQIVADHRVGMSGTPGGIAAPGTPGIPGIIPGVVPGLPGVIQPGTPGQPLTPPNIPLFPNVTLPGEIVRPGVGLPGLPNLPGQTQPQPPAVIPPGGGGTITSNAPGGNVGINMNMAAANTMAANHILTNQRLLVLMIEFNDMPMLQDSAFYYNKYFSTAPGAISVANYFREMSGGRNIFIPAGNVGASGTFNVNGTNVTVNPSTHSGIVHVRMDMPHPIARWSVPAGHETSRDTVTTALAAIHNNSNFDFAGVHVAAVFAGGEAADNYNPGGQVWAHAWQFRGSYVGQSGWPRYMAYGERQRGGHVIGIGMAVHELGHVLGLPDQYDLTGQSDGTGPYSVMALGAWGRAPGDAVPGHRPVGLDAWSRIQLGYIQPTIVSSGNWRGSINSLDTNNNNVIMVTSPVGPSQYFLIENRQTNNRWDAGMDTWFNNPAATGGIMIWHIDDDQRSTNPSDMTRNNNNRNHFMVGVREADGSNLLVNSVARWSATQDHFFSSGPLSEFNAQSNPNSNFHGGGGRNTATGVDITVHSARGNSMDVEINLSMSGGATGPRIGASGGAAGAAENPFNAPAANAPATAALNHARIQNQIAMNASVPTLAMPAGTNEVIVYGDTLRLLISGGQDLSVVNSRNVILPPAFLEEVLAAHSSDIYTIRVTAAGISIIAGGQIVLERQL